MWMVSEGRPEESIAPDAWRALSTARKKIAPRQTEGRLALTSPWRGKKVSPRHEEGRWITFGLGDNVGRVDRG